MIRLAPVPLTASVTGNVVNAAGAARRKEAIMIRYRAWLALPVLAGLFINTAPAARAAAGDTVQTTGGGWITPEVLATPTSTGIVRTAANNVKATFGFVASATVQADNTLGDFQGELSYHDHGTGLKLHSLVISNAVSYTHLTLPTICSV